MQRRLEQNATDHTLSQGFFFSFFGSFFFLLRTFDVTIPSVETQEPCSKYKKNNNETDKQKEAVMTLSTRRPLTESKGEEISPRSTVADTHFRSACELCGGQPLVGRRETERPSRPFRSTQLFVVVVAVCLVFPFGFTFLFPFFLSLLSFLYAACFPALCDE